LRFRPHALLAVACFIAALTLACSGDKPAPTPTPDGSGPPAGAAPTATPALPVLPPAPPIAWRRCNLIFECATYDVPLDYAHPDGDSMSLSLVRQPAKQPDQRIGTLFINPGGPGGSAIRFLQAWALIAPASIQARFDIAAFDPRGVGESSPLSCDEDVQAILAQDAYPESDADWEEIDRSAGELAQQCSAAAGNILPHLGTVNVARDMDRLREALGEEQLSYLGYSYGTVIGQVYADLFPTRFRAMVLDGAVDVSVSNDQWLADQILAFEATLGRYVEDCRRRNCLDRDPAEAIREVLRRADQSPIPAPRADRPAGSGEAVFGLITGLYSPATWPALDRAIAEALSGDATRLIRLADTLAGRRADGSYDNSLIMNVAVNCLDYASEPDPAYYRALADRLDDQAPLFGAYTATGGVLCSKWPAAAKPLTPPRAAGSPVILVVGTTGDPATPYKWAVGLSRQLENAVLLTHDGEGHTAFRSGSSCIDEAVTDYLVDLQAPGDGKTCGDAGIEPVPPVTR
jgi:pimeloyl-ACP methyl ester carboxylesterase